MRALGMTSTGTGSSSESKGKAADKSSDENELSREVSSAITSDPEVPTAFEEAFFVPKRNVWRPELRSFISRRAFKKRDKKQVIEQLRRKLMTTKWIFKEKINPDGTIKYKARCASREFKQIPVVDYTESVIPVVLDSGIRTVLFSYVSKI
jgi:Reverse transcriptase (RNA-dependent DNA polymerase)